MGDKLELFNEFEALVERLTKTFHACGAACLNEMELTFQQFIVMKLIYLKKSPKMTDLAVQLGVTLGNMTSMTDRLIKQGYVTRQADSEDRRVVRVCLTPKAKGMIDKAEEAKRKNMQSLLGKLSKDELKGLNTMIAKMVEM